MFCPKCSAYLLEKHIIKTKVKKFADVDVEYQARCPHCRTEMGTVIWGKLYVSKDLLQQIPGLAAQQDVALTQAPQEEDPLPVEPTEPKPTEPEADKYQNDFARPDDGSFYDLPSVLPGMTDICPCCGQKMPDSLIRSREKSTPSGPMNTGI